LITREIKKLSQLLHYKGTTLRWRILCYRYNGICQLTETAQVTFVLHRTFNGNPLILEEKGLFWE